MTSSFLCSFELIAHRQPATKIAHWDFLWIFYKFFTPFFINVFYFLNNLDFLYFFGYLLIVIYFTIR